MLFRLHHTTFSVLAALLLASCPETPAAAWPDVLAAEGSALPPNDKAPTVEALKALFYTMSPEDAGKELVVRYRVGPELVWKKEPQSNGVTRVWREPTGRTIGHASVNTAAFYRERAEKGPCLGGGTLRVRFELETGALIGRPLRDR